MSTHVGLSFPTLLNLLFHFRSVALPRELAILIVLLDQSHVLVELQIIC